MIYRSHGGWCPGHAVEGHRICPAHRHVVEQAARNRQRQALVDAAMREYLAHVPRLEWHEVVDLVWLRAEFTDNERGSIAMRYFHIAGAERQNLVNINIFTNYVDWVADGRVGPRPNTVLAAAQWHPAAVFVAPPPRAPGLGAIAVDRQNVHTTAVSKQTNELTQKILEKGGDDNKRHSRPADAIAYWLIRRTVTLSQLSTLSADIERFYNLVTVRTTNDYAYRRLFNALCAIIAQYSGEMRKELMKRFSEECIEAVGMCAEGHMTRLCNVLVGFDDVFKPPVPIGELLQQKISAISETSASLEEKLSAARAVFEELQIPDAERMPWVQALEAM